jgi:hypothetical protein
MRTSTPSIGRPTVPMRNAVGRVDGDDRRRLGEAVPLEDGDAGRVEELVDLGRERRAARHEVADAAARALLQLAEDELLGEAVLPGEHPARRAPGQLLVGPPVGHRARPAEDAPLRRAAGLRVLEHARVHLLVEPRHAHGHRRAHLLQRLRHVVDRRHVRDRRPDEKYM